ncbi:baseplate J/gp47 family protein [Desulfoluna spongiiphila]|uniref:baseplate J/gp47 family protein n=1 Tax=Desulfoluna spongiiphila TaxID=419481 RepID=UPI0012576766|nr:baseplate J/gp47 family protein [Desulfoluna spongiiphila]VVS94486.1 baseplate protein j-like [Desulfoluna spongiiphila]
MAEIKKTGGHQVVDYMARDYDSLLQAMRELVPSRLPEWQAGESEADFGNVLLELFAHMGDILSYYQDRVATESFLSTAQTRRSVIDHLKLIGYRLATASPASCTLELSFPASCEAVIAIEKGHAFTTGSESNTPSVRFEYTRETPLVIDCNALDVDPVTHRKHYGKDPVTGTGGVPVEEGRLVKAEHLGISDGSRNQRFPLTRTGLILRAAGAAGKRHRDILITTCLGETITEWTLQESLAFSRDNQKDYVIEIDEKDRTTVIFGDGSFGTMPESGAVITATYRVGGGLCGNVPAGAIRNIAEAPPLTLNGATVTHREAATGGADRESIDHAVMHAPSVFRSLKRAVTEEDYKALALNLKGVAKVKAVADSWNRVTLHVAPEGGGRVSDVLEESLLAYFEDKRPVTTLIAIEDVTYVPVWVAAEIGIKSHYPREEVRGKALAAAGELLALPHVDFAQTLYLSKFYEAMEAVEGVAFVNIDEFRRDNDPPGAVAPSGKIILEDHEIPVVPSGNAAYADGILLRVDGNR